MRTAKLAFIYSTIVVFLCFSAIGALGAFSVIKIDGWATAAAIIGPILAIVSAAIGAKHIFDDPEAITELKAEHAETIRAMEHGHADFVAERVAHERNMQAKHAQAIAAKDAEINAANVSAINEKTKRVETERQLSIYKPRPDRPDGSRIAPGYTPNTGSRPPTQE